MSRESKYFDASEPQSFEFDKPPGYCYDEANDCIYYKQNKCTKTNNTVFRDANGQRDICPYYNSDHIAAMPLEQCKELYEAFKSKRMSIREIAREYDLSYHSAWYRIHRYEELDGEYSDGRTKG